MVHFCSAPWPKITPPLTGCSNVQKVAIVPEASTSHSAMFTLYGCAVTTGTVTATLLRSGTVVATDTFDVTVKPPISMSLDSFLSPAVIVEGRSHEFRVLTSDTVPGRTFRVMISVAPSGTTVAGFNSGCTDSSRNSSTFDGTASEVASSFTLWACNATTTTMTLRAQLQVQDSGGTTWSDVMGPGTTPTRMFSVLPPPATSTEQDFGDISENSFKTIDIPMVGNPPASRLLLRVDESAGRAHVIEVLAQQGSMGDPVRVNRITVHTDSTYSEPPGYKHLGGNHAVWIAPSSAASSVRLIVLEVVNPLFRSGFTGYKVTISEPNVALIEHPTPTVSGLVIDSATGEATGGNIYLPLRVRNSAGALASVDVRVECTVTRGGTQEFTAGRDHGTFYVGAAPTETTLAVASICHGTVLQPGDEISLAAEITQGNPVHKHSVHASETVTWEHNIPSTLFHSQTSDLVGGLQFNAGHGACTSSFTLSLLEVASTFTTTREAISTTEHCAETVGSSWHQGPIPTREAPQVAVTIEAAEVTTCGMLQSLSSATSTSDCTIGDQSYGEKVSGVAGFTLDHGYIFKPGGAPIAYAEALRRPKIQYFTGVASTTRFRIDSARPPYELEMLHKVGRTTGWTSGIINAVIDFPAWTKDPTCPGGLLSVGDNKRDKSGYVECKSYAQFATARGDSGSPVFSRIGTTDSVVLVGVLYAKTNFKGIFIPIDRVYAEALKQGYDWSTSQQQLRPIPAPVYIDAPEPAAGETTRAIEATFEKGDFSASLYYQADLWRSATSTPDQVIQTCYVTANGRTDLGYPGHENKNRGRNCTISIGRLPDQRDSIIVSFGGHALSLTGTFRVMLRACKEIDSSTDRCGGYGLDGGQTATPGTTTSSRISPGSVPARQSLSVTPSGETTVGLSWADVYGIVRYRFEYVTSYFYEWITVDENVKSSPYSVLGLSCCITYDFMVDSHGDDPYVKT